MVVFDTRKSLLSGGLKIRQAQQKEILERALHTIDSLIKT